MQNFNICQQCWRPSIQEYGEFFQCPSCGCVYNKDLTIVQSPNPDLYSEYAISVIDKILSKKRGYCLNDIGLFLRDLELTSQESSFTWYFAFHHLTILYSHYELLNKSNFDEYQYRYTFPRPSPQSKRAYTGEFNDYPYIFYRLDDSPFANLSDDSFQIIYHPIVISTLPFPLSYLKTRKDRKKYFSIDDYRYKSFSKEKWRRSANELIDFGLIKTAPIKDNLELVSINKIRKELKNYGVNEIGRAKKDVIDNAIQYLPENVLIKLVDGKRAYIPTAKSIDEFRLITYGLKNLKDETRQYNLDVISNNEQKCTSEMYRNKFGFPKEPKSFLGILLELLEYGINSDDYGKYLASGNRPLEAFSGHILAQLGCFDDALNKIKTAYEYDIENNDVVSNININHFGALKRIKLQIELIKSLTDSEYKIQAEKTEQSLKMWVAMYKRITNDGYTSFLLDYFQEIFELFGCLCKDCENKFREKVGVPRIGEGWISEVELLNIIKELFPKENVVHQASPEWLGLQRIDIYLPKRKVAIEYQGRQHYESVEFFGGVKGLEKTQYRDNKKAELCESNNVRLIYFRYDEPRSKAYVVSKLRENEVL